jgi:hypothetical protein
MINFIMSSLSAGLLCATNYAKATNALSFIFNSPALFLFVWSVKGWFLITNTKGEPPALQYLDKDIYGQTDIPEVLLIDSMNILVKVIN